MLNKSKEKIEIEKEVCTSVTCDICKKEYINDDNAINIF